VRRNSGLVQRAALAAPGAAWAKCARWAAISGTSGQSDSSGLQVIPSARARGLLSCFGQDVRAESADMDFGTRVDPGSLLNVLVLPVFRLENRLWTA